MESVTGQAQHEIENSDAIICSDHGGPIDGIPIVGDNGVYRCAGCFRIYRQTINLQEYRGLPWPK